MTTGLTFKTSLANMGFVSTQPKQTVVSTQKITAIKIAPTTLVSSVKLYDFVTELKSPSTIISPSPIFTTLPAFKSINSLARPVDTRLQEKEIGPDVKYSAYESLTGISKIRPEILAVTNFQPVYDSVPKFSSDYVNKNSSTISGLNQIGEFLDAQIQLQHLKYESIVKLINDMKSSSDDLSDLLIKKDTNFKMHLSNLTSEVNLLFNISQRLDSLKQVIDIKNAKCLSYETLMYRFFNSLQEDYVTKLFDITSTNNLTFQKVLSERGFDIKNVNMFSSTKVFLQTLYEMGSLVKGNSYNLLGIAAKQQRTDADPVYINKHLPEGFSFSPGTVTTITKAELSSISSFDVLLVANRIKASYDALFASANFQSSESEIAFLSNFISHEFAFSKALSFESTTNFISKTFGYPISSTLSNSRLFDAVLGDIGDKIIDRTDGYSTTSIANIANKVVDNISILPFENDYIEFEQSEHTPGSSYLIDSALQLTSDGFNITNMQTFSDDLKGCLERFSSFIKKMYLIPTGKKALGSVYGSKVDQFLNSKLLFEYILHFFVDKTTNQPKSTIFASDIPAVFNAAKKDNYLKSLLFIYFNVKSSTETLNSSSEILDIIINEIDSRLKFKLGNVAPTQNTNQAESFLSNLGSIGSVNSKPLASSTSQDSLLNELKELRGTSEFLNSIFTLFKSFRGAFEISKAFNDDGSTRFNHVDEAALMMIIFDLILSVVSSYVPKQFVGQFTTKSSSTLGKTYFSVSSKQNTNSLGISVQSDLVASKNPISINTVRSKLDNEVNSLVKMCFMTLSALASTKDSIDATLKILKQGYTNRQIDSIVEIVGDKDLFSLSMTHQQILLIKSMLDDITDKINNPEILSKSGDISIDFEQRGNSRDDLQILDDSIIPQNLKKALFASLANENYSSEQGKNVRLVTIGIPIGLAGQIKQKVLLQKLDKDSFNQKQTDIVRINVYKIDYEHQDLIFKPQSFLFELSRFTPRTGVGIKNFSFNSSFTQILDSIPTRDYSVLSTGVPVTDSATALNTADYDFLTQNQKLEIPRNHSFSYLLEIYIKLLTGLSLSEYDLDMSDQSIIMSADQEVVNNAVDYVLSKAINKNIQGLNLQNLIDLQTNISSESSDAKNSVVSTKAKFESQVSTNLESYSSIVESLKRAKTTYSSPEFESKRIFSPKLFDRVFTVPIDPDNFEIDSVETLKTFSGKESFDKLLKQGIIIESENQSTFFASALTAPKYKLRQRDISENDLTFEKYFVTIDTIFDEVT